MILETTGSKIHSPLPVQAFGIEANAVAYQTLFKNIYTRPIDASIREVSCNAVDAFNEHGLSDIRWDVHVPTILEPYYSVRDYATGLSKEFMSTNYLKVFSSTKRASADVTGGLGIGRLAPLAYTGSTYTVTSWYEGIKTEYLITLEHDEPRCIELSSVPSDEHSGLKVQFNVKPEDIITFQNTCSNLYKYFDHKPNINLDIQKVNYRLQDPDGQWFIDANAQGGIILMAGNVQYRLNVTYGSPLYDMRNLALVFKVPIGSFSFDPGRENVVIDAKLRALEQKLAKYLTSSLQKAITLLVKKINTDTRYEYWVKLIEVHRDLPNSGIRIDTPTIDGLSINARGYNHNSTGLLLVQPPRHNIQIYSRSYKNPRNIEVLIRGPEAETFVVYDISVSAAVKEAVRSQLYTQSAKLKWIYCIKPKSGGKKELELFLKTGLQTILDTLGNPPVLYLSKLISSVQVQQNSQTATTPTVQLSDYAIYRCDTGTPISLGRATNIPQSSYKYYIPVKDGKYRLSKYKDEDIAPLAEGLQIAGKLVGVAVTKTKQAEADGLVNFEQYASSKLSSIKVVPQSMRSLISNFNIGRIPQENKAAHESKFVQLTNHFVDESKVANTVTHYTYNHLIKLGVKPITVNWSEVHTKLSQYPHWTRHHINGDAFIAYELLTRRKRK